MEVSTIVNTPLLGRNNQPKNVELHTRDGASSSNGTSNGSQPGTTHLFVVTATSISICPS